MIVVCGEALVDLVAEPGGRFTARMGGSPANTAVTLGRLGASVALLARLSGDAFGARLRNHLEVSGVDLSLAAAAEEPTTLAIAVPGAQGQAEYSFYMQGTADWQWRQDEMPTLPLPQSTSSTRAAVSAVVAGSLALLLPPGNSVLEGFWSTVDAVRVLDPNVRPPLAGDPAEFRAKARRWVGSAHLVKVSEDDLTWIQPDQPPPQTAADWHAKGAGPVVVGTADARGAWVLAGGRPVVSVPGRPVDVVDTVGAGDSFTGALLDALERRGALTPTGIAALDDEAWRAVLRRAVQVSAITCTRTGADPPWRDEIPDEAA